MAGLFSLAVGLGGESLMWGPVATAIFWGLAFSTALTLGLIPLLAANFTPRVKSVLEQLPQPMLAIGLQGQLAALGLRPANRFVVPAKAFADDPETFDLIKQGLQALREPDYLEAIRLFDLAAGQETVIRPVTFWAHMR